MNNYYNFFFINISSCQKKMLLQKSHHNPIGYSISCAEHIENACNSIKLFTVKKIITKTRGMQGNNYVGIMSSIDDLSIFIKKKNMLLHFITDIDCTDYTGTILLHFITNVDCIMLVTAFYYRCWLQCTDTMLLHFITDVDCTILVPCCCILYPMLTGYHKLLDIILNGKIITILLIHLLDGSQYMYIYNVYVFELYIKHAIIFRLW